jgi:hypothetical protein
MRLITARAFPAPAATTLIIKGRKRSLRESRDWGVSALLPIRSPKRRCSVTSFRLRKLQTIVIRAARFGFGHPSSALRCCPGRSRIRMASRCCRSVADMNPRALSDFGAGRLWLRRGCLTEYRYRSGDDEDHPRQCKSSDGTDHGVSPRRLSFSNGMTGLLTSNPVCLAAAVKHAACRHDIGDQAASDL